MKRIHFLSGLLCLLLLFGLSTLTACGDVPSNTDNLPNESNLVDPEEGDGDFTPEGPVYYTVTHSKNIITNRQFSRRSDREGFFIV